MTAGKVLNLKNSASEYVSGLGSTVEFKKVVGMSSPPLLSVHAHCVKTKEAVLFDEHGAYRVTPEMMKMFPGYRAHQLANQRNGTYDVSLVATAAGTLSVHARADKRGRLRCRVLAKNVRKGKLAQRGTVRKTGTE